MVTRLTRFPLLALLCGLVFLSSCDNNDDDTPAYDVPATYSFEGADYSAATNRVKMAVALNTYLGNGTRAELNQVTVANMFNNSSSPFAESGLNNSGVSLSDKTADKTFYQAFMNEHVEISKLRDVPALPGTDGYITRGTGTILVNEKGLEVNQAVAKGMMGSLLFKEAMALLASVPNQNNTTITNGTTAMQRTWDDAFGYLGIPADYDTAKVYTNTDANRPLLWGGYLRERGRPIKAGGVLFEAFRKGRAAIGAKDNIVRDEQIKIIQDTWEKLGAISALSYATIPQASTSVGNLGTQFHALSEGYGFVLGLKYRPASSKLTEPNFLKLKDIFETNYYTLINEPGFVKLKEAQNILKTTYGL